MKFAALIGWTLLAVGVVMAFVEPHFGRQAMMLPGAILVAGHLIASAIDRSRD
ncbi:MAG: hypothetical protein KDA61_01645 [Planctomycetales bacterium]|nr:hypothetical protein [Planctomycetales bacterium]